MLTLPASFDEVARELTVKAAALAGLRRVVLIEEPQAAFYAWIYAHADDWERLVPPGQKILVCDIGGGTSDFTLIRVRRGEGGKVQFHRVAVGDHLILGGDNLDVALAQHIERKLGGKLEPRQWAVLVRTCRAVKETLLGPDAPERLTVSLPGSGTRLVGGGIHVEVTRDEVCDVLVEGFFPRVGLDEKPTSRRSGFQEFGLPFAPDPAITRYLAAFLTAHRHVALDDEKKGTSPICRDSPEGAGKNWTCPLSPGPRSGPARRGVVQRRRVRIAVAPRADVGSAGELVRRPRPRTASRRARSPSPGNGTAPRPRSCWTTTGSTWPSPAAPPTTAWCGAARACGSPPDWPARTTSAWNRGRPHHPPAAVAGVRRPCRRPPAASSSLPGRLPPAGGHRAGPRHGARPTAVRPAGLRAGRVSAVRLQHAIDRQAGRIGADRSRADDAAAADPDRAADAEEGVRLFCGSQRLSANDLPLSGRTCTPG